MELRLLVALKDWTTLNRVLNMLTEDDVNAMLEHELATKKRRTISRRLHERYGILRSKREWAEIESILAGE
jgi:hypothetical protein